MTTSSSSPAVLQALRSPRRLTTEVLAGAVTTLALIPEVISFSVIAGVDPKVSLIASVVLAISMTFLGGRPAMITAAAGAPTSPPPVTAPYRPLRYSSPGTMRRTGMK